MSWVHCLQKLVLIKSEIHFLYFTEDAGGGFSDPSHGKILEPTETGLIYIPDASFCGYDTFDYEITSDGLSETATVHVHILCDGDTPHNTIENALPDTATVSANMPNTLKTINVLDTGGIIINRMVINGNHGDCAISNEGQLLTYTPGK